LLADLRHNAFHFRLAARTGHIEAMQYLNMDPLQEQKKEALRKLGDAA